MWYDDDDDDVYFQGVRAKLNIVRVNLVMNLRYVLDFFALCWTLTHWHFMHVSPGSRDV